MLDKTILVTGFGPYGEHPINSSWESVRLLNELNFDCYKLILHEVPVTYEYINQNIAKLWELHKPTFVMHVGASKGATTFKLESKANRKPYVKADADGNYHPTGEICSPEEGPDTHYPDIDVQRIVEELNSDDLKFIKSIDAGLFLCEYIYYTSLNVDKNRVLFIHVPPLDKPYSAEKLAEGLTLIIIAALRQLDNKNTNK